MTIWDGNLLFSLLLQLIQRLGSHVQSHCAHCGMVCYGLEWCEGFQAAGTVCGVYSECWKMGCHTGASSSVYVLKIEALMLAGPVDFRASVSAPTCFNTSDQGELLISRGQLIIRHK